MSKITTHVLDTVQGKPAAGVPIRLEKGDAEVWTQMASGATDSDGRCNQLQENIPAGRYRLIFDTGRYLKRLGRASIYPEISIAFQCDGISHYHLPLLLSDNGYTTYRGS